MSGGADPASCDFDVVTVSGVSRHYGRRRALSQVSLECRSATITGLFGPNGAGKSTLLGVLSTLSQPTTGEARYGTRTSREWGDRIRSRIGVLGHDLFLYSDLTARENLLFFGRLYGTPDVDARVASALKAAGLEERGDDRVAGFSRGMRQRLALERALLHGPRLVLLDEPFTGLDDASVQRLVERLASIRRDGAIVVMATHDLDVAEGLVDAACCLARGRLVSIPEGQAPLRERYRQAIGPAAS